MDWLCVVWGFVWVGWCMRGWCGTPNPPLPITSIPLYINQMVRQLARALEGRVDVHEVMVDRICVDRSVAETEIDVRACVCIDGPPPPPLSLA